MWSHVLVTGGGGFIGSHLTEQLLRCGASVSVLDDGSTGPLEELPRHPRLSLHEGSVLNAGSLRRAADGAAAVFHLAGVVGMRLASLERERAYSVAVEGTRRVLAATPDLPIVLFSSSAVYGFRNDVPLPEDAAVNASELLDYDGGAPGYATGKGQLERLGHEAAARGRDVLIVRPYNIVGSRQSARYGMVLPTFVKQALQGRPLTIFGDGTQQRSFGDVSTFVDALLKIARDPGAWDPDRRVINIGNPKPISIYDLAQLVIRETRSAAGVRFIPYDRIYPGRRDVLERVPHVKRLRNWIGDPGWREMDDVVQALCREGQAAARGASAGSKSSSVASSGRRFAT